METSIYEALQEFSASVTAKSTPTTPGGPEEQLRGPFENFMADAAKTLGWKVVCKGETPLPGRIGRPDYAVLINQLPAGYVELKAPGVGANNEHFRGHNLDQFKRFSAVPNILYSDGNEWALYRDGKRVKDVVRLTGNIAEDGKKAAKLQDARAVENLLREFLLWKPSIPLERNDRIDLKGFATLLAPLCRLLRDEVKDALENPSSPLVRIREDWRKLLFPDASDEQFADAYAQTVTFALLLGRSEGAEPLTRRSAHDALAVQHSLLSKALLVLTDDGVYSEILAPVELLLRVIGAVPPTTLTGPDDPWLYFYEDFLSVYDPDLRRNVGAYYTPVEVVRAQVRLIDELLVRRLGKPLGFADPGVFTLDPAVGTGTYLLGVIEHALGRVKLEQGAGAVPGQATTLAENLHAFELMVGPYAVSELRVNRALRDYGATLPISGTKIYLTDTLESPRAEPPQVPLFFEPIAEQHAKALKVKRNIPVIVCLGNPPYDRHDALDTTSEDNLSPYGGWVRFGDPLPGNVVKDRRGRTRELNTVKARLDRRQELAILREFRDPAIAAGHGGHVKNLYNLYVYFWRWALWKVFEDDSAKGPGIVSFISASGYLDGDALCGMREHMRRVCEEIWILDLGGEGRGARQSENVFAIRTPVAISVALRSKRTTSDKPARVRYALIEGTRKDKLALLDAIKDFSHKELKWQDCPDEWQAPFLPAGTGNYFDWPPLTDLMPWQQSGVKAGRTWVIAPEKRTLEERWATLLEVEKDQRNEFFKDSSTGRKVHQRAIQLPPSSDTLEAISNLARGEPSPENIRFAYRSFDRQFICADARLLDRPGPALWRVHSPRQVYLSTMLQRILSKGPALTCTSLVPDLNHFCNRGAKDAFPLYRTADATKANITPGLLRILCRACKRDVPPEEFVAYVYGMLAHPGFTTRFESELESRQLRVPITKDAALFDKVCGIGTRLLWMHTYGERFITEDQPRGHVPTGTAKCIKGVPGDAENYPESFSYNNLSEILRVGDGEFRPVPPDVYEFEVSGLKVVQSWLKYRMKRRAGRKSSDLDEIRPTRWTSQFTTELLDLLWVLEATVKTYPEQARLLEAVIEGDCFHVDEFPPVPAEMRKPPKAQQTTGDLFYGVKGE